VPTRAFFLVCGLGSVGHRVDDSVHADPQPVLRRVTAGERTLHAVPLRPQAIRAVDHRQHPAQRRARAGGGDEGGVDGRHGAVPPGEVVGPGVDSIRRAFELIAEGEDINYEGAAGSQDFDENGDVFSTIEIWKIEGGAIVSVRYELP